MREFHNVPPIVREITNTVDVPNMTRKNTPLEGAPPELTLLHRLHRQLSILAPTLVVAPGKRETAAMTAHLAETVVVARELLATAEPDALVSLHRALDFVEANDFDAACSDLAYAQHRLSVLLRRGNRG